MGNAFFLVYNENPKVSKGPANLHKACKETRDQAYQLIAVPEPFYQNRLRMMSHTIEQINASFRFTKFVLVCLLKVVNISFSFKTKIVCTFTDKTEQLTHKTYPPECFKEES